jgi:hemin uptake protein HemP
MVIICNMQSNDESEKSAAPVRGADPWFRVAPRRITSRELFAGARELVIEHDGRHYQLRITQNGKLILTA